jgi:hypothetical protein
MYAEPFPRIGERGGEPDVPGIGEGVRQAGTHQVGAGRQLAPESGYRHENKGRSSFLKKRSKKLLSIAFGRMARKGPRMKPETDKSFLLLFFKKEVLPSLRCIVFPQ